MYRAAGEPDEILDLQVDGDPFVVTGAATVGAQADDGETTLGGVADLGSGARVNIGAVQYGQHAARAIDQRRVGGAGLIVEVLVAQTPVRADRHRRQRDEKVIHRARRVDRADRSWRVDRADRARWVRWRVRRAPGRQRVQARSPHGWNENLTMPMETRRREPVRAGQVDGRALLVGHQNWSLRRGQD